MITLSDVQKIEKDVAEIQRRIAAIDAHFVGERIDTKTHAVLVMLATMTVLLNGWEVQELEEWEPNL